MAREYAQIGTGLWLSDEWRSLTPPAQHLFMLVLSDPELSYAGVTDWKPARLVQRAAEWSVPELMGAAGELSAAFWLVFDQETDEVMVRSFLRHDSLLKQPRMAVSMANAFAAIGSNKLRAAVVFELARLRKERPDLPAWDKPQVKTVLRQRGVNPKEMDTDLDMPLGIGLPIGLPETRPGVWVSPTTATATTTSTSPISKEIAGGFGRGYPQGEPVEAPATEELKPVRSVRAS